MSAETKVIHLGLSPRAANVLRDALGAGDDTEAGCIIAAIRDELDDQLAGGRHPSRPADATLADLIAERMARAAATAVREAA